MNGKVSAIARHIVVAFIVASGSFAFAAAASDDASHIKAVTAITEVFGDGQKVTAAAVEYDAVIDAAKLSASSFAVDGRSVTKVYANGSAAKAAQGTKGRYVIIELSPEDQGAAIMVQSGRTMTRKDAKVSVTQTGPVTTAEGKVYAADARAVANGKVINLVVDDFAQLEYKDPKTALVLKYNLFVPKDYDASKSYPLVLFMHDAGATSDITNTTLIQGLGAVVWATPSEQGEA